ncbi:hypothetical protein [Pseudohoeflea coraliihabitans]|uniref:Uncharacterized protein n=1 Tax=Pseudohoeflea coraliihabitans TaxID=2860393 RepID=A0ABS6WTD8_9HYPH|nr:hypothetical protein [Pseudohoeflea sp. DP4N28-3]MBW3099223.1 hypothetical protein [Pseudohoeflea sp. DP4N28-3]
MKLTEAHRDKIKNSNILNALVEHVEGKREMSATQVTAGLGLLRKCLPDLAAVEHNGTLEHGVSDPLKELLSHVAQKGSRLVDRD